MSISIILDILLPFLCKSHLLSSGAIMIVVEILFSLLKIAGGVPELMLQRKVPLILLQLITDLQTVPKSFITCLLYHMTMSMLLNLLLYTKPQSIDLLKEVIEKATHTRDFGALITIINNYMDFPTVIISCISAMTGVWRSPLQPLPNIPMDQLCHWRSKSNY